MRNIRESLSKESMDILLDRILEVGYENLTDREKDMLNNPEKYDDIELNYFSNEVYREKYTKRIKIYDDDDIHISMSKEPNDEGNMIFFITLKNIEEKSTLGKFVFLFNPTDVNVNNNGALVFKLEQRDIYDNSPGKDKKYLDYIKEIEKPESVEEYDSQIVNVSQMVANVIRSIIMNHNAGLEGDENNPEDYD